MSSKDIDNIGDAELEALLRTLPQPAPSAELDAAVLAAAEAALRVDAAAMPAAANDAVMPQPSRRSVPGFLSRWKVPLAFAASVLLTVNMIGPRWFTSTPDDFPATLAEMPAARAPEAPQAAAQPQLAVVAEAPAPAASHAARSSERARRAAPEPQPAAAMAADTARQQSAPMERADTARAIPEQLALMPAPAPQMERRQRMAAPMGKMTPAAAAANARADEVAPKEPQAWLRQIERQLDSDTPRAALDEWAKFRLAYPDYPAPQELAERIDALKK